MFSREEGRQHGGRKERRKGERACEAFYPANHVNASHSSGVTLYRPTRQGASNIVLCNSTQRLFIIRQPQRDGSRPCFITFIIPPLQLSEQQRWTVNKVVFSRLNRQTTRTEGSSAFFIPPLTTNTQRTYPRTGLGESRRCSERTDKTLKRKLRTSQAQA